MILMIQNDGSVWLADGRNDFRAHLALFPVRVAPPGHLWGITVGVWAVLARTTIIIVSFGAAKVARLALMMFI